MNLQKLNQVIADSGITITALADKCELSRTALYSKISGETEFKLSEASRVREVLRLTPEEMDEIFFA